MQPILPGVNTQPPHQESGVDQMSFAEEARRAAESAAKQSSPKKDRT
jgi:hypothetical protein